jgi:dipeptidyl aminopeptidase/acylaminoacyl peptidase
MKSQPQFGSSQASLDSVVRVVQSNRSSLHKESRKFLSVVASCAMVLAIVGTAHATFPGRNGLIAFQSQTGAGLQIFTVHPDGRGLRQITFLSGDAIAADWSPDGRLIVFEHDSPGACSNVAIMNADGTGLTEFPDPTVCQDDPSFTPDGSRIIFHRFDPAANDEAFWSMDLNGNDRQRIGTCCADPNVSPNGERLSFVSFNGQPTGAALFTSNLDGSNLFQVTPFEFDVAVKQDWSPDGKRLVFTQDGDEPIPGVSANIATIRPDGTHLRLLTHFQGGDVKAFAGSYSPDGRWIVFRLEDHGLFGLFKMNPNGTHVTTILPLSSFRPSFIDWGARPTDVTDDDDEGQ